MPIIKSAKKRVRVAKKATIRNVKTKRSLKAAIKSFISKPSADAHAKAQSALDKAAKKGVMHKNKAARKKRQLAAQAKAAGTKLAAAKKNSAKKTTTVKSAGQRTAAKKTPVKKTAKK